MWGTGFGGRRPHPKADKKGQIPTRHIKRKLTGRLRILAGRELPRGVFQHHLMQGREVFL